MDNLCGFCAIAQKHTDKWKVCRMQVVKAGVRMGARVGVEGRVEVKRKRKSMEGWRKSGRTVCWEKCREEVEKNSSLFCCRSSKSREKRLKGWRKTVETEYQRNVVLLSALELRNSFVSRNFTLTE